MKEYFVGMMQRGIEQVERKSRLGEATIIGMCEV